MHQNISPLLTHVWFPIIRVPLSQTPSGLSQDRSQAWEPPTHTEHLSPSPSQQEQNSLPPEHGSCLLVSEQPNKKKIHKKKMRASSQALAITSPCCSCLGWFVMCYRDLCVSRIIPRATGTTRGCQAHRFLYLKALKQIPLVTDSSDCKWLQRKTRLFLHCQILLAGKW